MKTKSIFFGTLCLLFILASAMCCEETIEDISELTGIELTQYDNSGETPVIREDARCPKEAYLLRIQPIWKNYWDINILKSPITHFHIITLTDFDESHPAGSDIYDLFKEYPAGMLSNALGDDPLQRGETITKLGCKAFYKALLTYPQPGTYQFRVELKTEDGNTFSEETTPINLY